MIAVPFTQYALPYGRKSTVHIDMPDDVAGRALSIIESGLALECEILRNGQVSFTITHPDDGDLDIRVCANGPCVPDVIADLIMNFKPA